MIAPQSLRIYLGGPDTTFHHSHKTGARKKALCAERGFEGLWPLDNPIPEKADGSPQDAEIYRKILTLMETSHCAIFNLSAFRGPAADDRTAFELGYAIALGKPCFGYVNDPMTISERTAQLGLVDYDEAKGEWRVGHGQLVENWGHPQNLMIANAIRQSGHDIVRAPKSCPIDDLAGFETCLTQVMVHFASRIYRRTYCDQRGPDVRYHA